MKTLTAQGFQIPQKMFIINKAVGSQPAFTCSKLTIDTL